MSQSSSAPRLPLRNRRLCLPRPRPFRMPCPPAAASTTTDPVHATRPLTLPILCGRPPPRLRDKRTRLGHQPRPSLSVLRLIHFVLQAATSPNRPCQPSASSISCSRRPCASRTTCACCAAITPNHAKMAVADGSTAQCFAVARRRGKRRADVCHSAPTASAAAAAAAVGGRRGIVTVAAATACAAEAPPLPSLTPPLPLAAPTSCLPNSQPRKPPRRGASASSFGATVRPLGAAAFPLA
mmetsp:Transcript_13404/g.38898  ORF Transcript_13404/g.38898 Transcript_13404/m.38898 type:complete len:240 (-) Transcript_13404:504-1223(-)